MSFCCSGYYKFDGVRGDNLFPLGARVEETFETEMEMKTNFSEPKWNQLVLNVEELVMVNREERARKVQWKYLPDDIWNQIFLLYLDYESVVKCRVLQSKYVRKCTEFNSIQSAIRSNNLKNMKWIYHCTGMSSTTIFPHLDLAAQCGNLEIIQWLREVGCKWGIFTFQCAAACGNLKNMMWLKEKDCPWDSGTFQAAAQCGNFKNMRWLKANECPWGSGTFYVAAHRGDREQMMWLHTNGCPWDPTSFQAVAQRGDLEAMKWMKSKGCPWDARTFAWAAEFGKLENMKWLKANKCPWDCNTFQAAASHGSLETLIWLKENNCPWDSRTFDVAAVMQKSMWMKTIDCPWGSETLKNLEWLSNNNCPRSETLPCSGNSRHSVFEWLVKHSYPSHERSFKSYLSRKSN